MSLLALILLVPVTLFVMLSLPSIQNNVRSIGEQELSKLLCTDVSIGEVSIAPFNRLTLRDIAIKDVNNDTALFISRLGAGINLTSLFKSDRITINYAEIIGLDARLSKESPDAPLNIRNIINALKPKDKSKPPTLFDLKVNTIVIRKSCLTYDIISAPHDTAKFDRNHISVSGIKADIMLPHIKNDDFAIDIKRFALQEQSGFTLQELKGKFHIASTGLATQDVTISFPESEIAFSDISIKYNGWDGIKDAISSTPTGISFLPESYISTNDLTFIIPTLNGLNKRLNLQCDIYGCLNSLDIKQLSIVDSDKKIEFKISGHVDSIGNKNNTTIDIPLITAKTSGSEIVSTISAIKQLPDKTSKLLTSLGYISINGNLNGNIKNASFTGNVSTSAGHLVLSTKYNRASDISPIHFRGKLRAPDINLKRILDNGQLGMLDANTDFDIAYNKNYHKGNISCNINNIDFKGYCYSGIDLQLDADNNSYIGHLDISDNNIDIKANGEVLLDGEASSFSLNADLRDINLAALNIWEKHPGNRLSAIINADFTGSTPDNTNGTLTLSGIKFTDNENNGLEFDNITVETHNTTLPQYTTITSDVIEGEIEGSYSIATVIPAFKDIMSHVFPALLASDEKYTEQLHSTIKKTSGSRPNDFTYSLTLKDNEQLGKFFKTPINIIYPISINGAMSHTAHCLSLNINAPYLQQKNKLIKNTALHFNIDGFNDQCQLYATSVFPTKKGPLSLLVECNGQNDRIDSDISWDIQHERTFKGGVNFSTAFDRNENNDLSAGININPSQLVFNDTAWSVSPARIDVSGKYVSVEGFDVRRDNQFITLSGTASPEPGDSLCLQLLNVNLDYVFSTLAIDNVMFGGTASGTFYASDLFSKTPSARTPGLYVQNLSYNRGVLGNAIIKSQWKNDDKAVTIDADISQANGRKSRINGAIFPLNDSLDFTFDADRINIQFMKPFMQAFTSDIDGMASGKARLWGNFKYIDMTGDIFAEDLKLKLDFTNTYYFATDSIHLRPGNISFGDVVLKDIYGNQAKLNGWLTHECFKRPKFEFAITEANNLLCYDVTEKMSPIWYGHIFGYGSAFVSGKPGLVDINVDMSTAPKSVFTFVLSDAEEASEYSFLTFRNKETVTPTADTQQPIDTIPDIVKQLEARIASSQATSSSVYNMNIRVDVTPNAQMILVMDPIGGDRIRANGSGVLRMEYNSANEDLKMFGKYILEKGDYNFTLQDIIVKKFNVRNGSSIKFDGDPYAAQLNIDAVYSVNANLSDLDESFLTDKNLNQTNVPVYALLNVDGDMRQPDISFDLEFPDDKTGDIYRKVKSIVSTEDMMKRQIIYLLALNRFYTPEYMESTTKGSELVSVATSTISSQLSSILGELSDNWNISPNFRSDRGDFSDVEVDLALSSTLLNNRLLFNGNFGYRDNDLNNNTFIGDFDIEYLLNKRGHIRLKAYNRYNDQNFYLKTAATTQGVGIVYKRDFDNILSFLRPLMRKKKSKSQATTLTEP